MLKRIQFFAVAAFLLGAHALFAASHPLTVPVGGNFVDVSGHTGTFTGQFALLQFAAENNQLVAKGFLSGIMTDSTGHVIGSVMKDVAIPVAVSSGAPSTAHLSQGKLSIITNATCPILHLDLGPLHLDLLGLRVDLSEVVLDISAESGGGNLLGNLLCAVTHLLDGAGTLVDLADLLNRILQAISGLLG